MSQEPPHPRRLAALGVHVFTASGAALAFLALLATIEGRVNLAFLALGVAMIVDGVDGTLARKVEIERAAPRFDGALLDLVVDYTTYVFVPVMILWTTRTMPDAVALPVLVVVLVTAALYFADREMKTGDGWFQGFPGLWNLVAFHLVLFPLPWGVVALLLLGLAAAQFAPIRVCHPMRTRAFHVPTLVITVVWSIAALVVTWRGMVLDPLSATALLLGLAWFGGLGFVRDRRP
jgi:phosphatidylcholine synthase